MTNARSVTQIAIAPGAGDRKRLAMMAAGVAVGVMLAALLFSGFFGLGDRSERSSWIYGSAEESTQYEGQPLGPDEFAAASVTDYYDGRAITVLLVAGAEHAAIPGTREGAAAGTSWVSPALAHLIDETPADELGDRFGTVTATLSDRVLAGPDSLVAVVGVPESQLNSSFRIVHDLTGYRYVSETYSIIAALGAIAVLIPVFILLRIVTSLGSVDRSARMRALHMLGATAVDRAKFAFAEAGLVGLVGAIGGVILAWFAAIPVSLVSVNGSRFFADDLRLGLVETLALVVLVPLVFGTIAAVAAARADAQPSSVRERAEKPLSWTRVIPLILGIGLFAFMMLTREFTEIILIGSFVLIALGILLVGPLVTHGIASIAHRRAQKAAGVVAYARIRQHPRQIFRAVSGVVIAVFLVSLFMSGVTSVREGEVRTGDGYLATDILVNSLDTSGLELTEADSLADAVAQTPGVTGFVRVYAGEDGGYFASGAELATVGITTPEQSAGVTWNPLQSEILDSQSIPGTPSRLAALFIKTDSPQATERVRTLTAQLSPLAGGALTRAEYATNATSTAREYRSLAVLGILVAAGVSAIALAAATMSAVRDRRRTLGLMRLTGMPFSVVRGIMMREAVVPLVAATLISAVVGYGTGWLMVTGLSYGDRTVPAPPLEYYVVIALTIAVSILAVLTAIPAARRATNTENTRFE